MLSFVEAIILGIVQGITEWLPISSSGHLVLLQSFFKIEEPIVFDVMLHFGSVLVILFVFFDDIKKIFLGLLSKDKKYMMVFLYLVIATIPIAIVGFFLNDIVESFFTNIKYLGFCFLFTGILLFLSRYPKTKKKKLGFKNVILIGLAQAIAILPGVSRSGSTISAALIQGVKQEDAARFSFLLAIPAILGASVLELGNLSQIDNLGAMIFGVVATVITGYFSLKLLLKIIKKNMFSYFWIYCFVIGIFALFIGFF